MERRVEPGLLVISDFITLCTCTYVNMHYLCIEHVYMYTYTCMHKLPRAVQPSVAYTISGQAVHMQLYNQFIAYLSECGYTRHLRTCQNAAIHVNQPSGISQAADIAVNHPQGVNNQIRHA